jgi:2-polyprenyl-3-methyl-5-hydroxy-6-metoxy-1,4-benzoquinol methylase
MEPNAFVAEVYRRMSLRHAAEHPSVSWAELQNDPQVLQAVYEYRSLLPVNKDASILDIGFGRGWFIAACLKLGYSNLSGADFGTIYKGYIKNWSPESITVHEITSNIGEFLSAHQEEYHFIHMSHVIEHIPKYSLLWVVDGLYWALKHGSTLLLRTPNMEGPCANSSFYVTMAHEYGFAGANLKSLLDICGFDNIEFHEFSSHQSSLKQRIGRLFRLPYLLENRFRHRLFGVNEGGQFGAELVVTAKRGQMKPFLDHKYE